MQTASRRSSLRSHRKRWHLKQDELGALLDMSRSAVAKAETTDRLPSVKLLVATEFLFGVGARDLFPTLFEQVEQEVAQRAAALQGQLAPKRHRLPTNIFLSDLLTRATCKSYPVCQQLTLFL
jgi:DNA-binding XRE family transcriptional regulator